MCASTVQAAAVRRDAYDQCQQVFPSSFFHPTNVYTHTHGECVFILPFSSSSSFSLRVAYSKLFAAADDKSPFLNIDSTFLLFALP